MKSIVLCALGVCLCDESQKSYTPPAPLCRDLQYRRPLHSQGNKSIICQLGLAFLQFDNAEVLHVLSVCSEILNLLKAEVFLKCHLELWSQRWVLGVIVWRTLFSSLIYSMLIGPSLWQLGPLDMGNKYNLLYNHSKWTRHIWHFKITRLGHKIHATFCNVKIQKCQTLQKRYLYCSIDWGMLFLCIMTTQTLYN